MNNYKNKNIFDNMLDVIVKNNIEKMNSIENLIALKNSITYNHLKELENKINNSIDDKIDRILMKS